MHCTLDYLIISSITLLQSIKIQNAFTTSAIANDKYYGSKLSMYTTTIKMNR